MGSGDGSSAVAGEHDYDYLIVGSGFGGSVSALRLAEKGYRVAVLECGRRFEDEDFAKSAWNLRRYFWLPQLGLRGILRLSLFKDVFIGSGSGVGGGSLGYANTLYRARSSFYRHPQWQGLAADWEGELGRHYDTAERMLGVTDCTVRGPADELLLEYAQQLGVEDTWKQTRVGIFLGEPGEPAGPAGDPFFGGEGPERHACIRCGGCMLGCRHGAKNTLVKNYLYFAERLGVEIMPERQVTEIRPLGAGDGSDGYEVSSVRSGSIVRKRRRKLTAGAVIVAAGALGTNRLLRSCKHSGALPAISDRLGELVRTNSESIMAVTAPDDSRDFASSIAITSSIYPDPDTHIEVVTYGRGGDALSGINTLMTREGNAPSRILQWLATAIRHPRRLLAVLNPRHWSRRTVILLVMQTLDNAIRLVPKRRLLGRGVRLQTAEDPERPNPRYIQAAADATEWIAERIGGTPQGGITESLLNIPTTAHILGGAVIGADPSSGVVDARHRVFGYESLLVCDGAAMPANPGVNPSLTITTMAERAMSLIPPKPGTEPGHLPEQARPAAHRGPAEAAPA